MIEGDFDALDFAAYIRGRWVVVAVSCGIAVVLAYGVSRALPRGYTATATILIQPPGGNDPRAATAVSPVYLESLKSYETFASSDTLFAKALATVHVEDSGSTGPVESIKQRVLKVSKPLSTSLLEISATLEDPKKAQALAQYVAAQTVELNRSLDSSSAAEMENEYRTQLNTAKERYRSARQAHVSIAAAEPLEGLENEVEEATDLKFRLERDLEVARTDLADYSARHPQGGEDQNWLQQQIVATRARVVALEGQINGLGESLAKKSPLLEAGKVRRGAMESDEKAALAAFETANSRLNEILSSSAFHGERLQMLDPGIVPQRPSSPNTMLNTLAALLFALVGSVVWLGFRFSHARLGRGRPERLYSYSNR
jgi:capsular polysaccharide biosynthesis protein